MQKEKIPLPNKIIALLETSVWRCCLALHGAESVGPTEVGARFNFEGNTSVCKRLAWGWSTDTFPPHLHLVDYIRWHAFSQKCAQSSAIQLDTHQYFVVFL